MKTYIAILIITLFIVSFIVVVNLIKPKLQPQTKLFQGPVPEGFDEEHFRQTGETIPLKNG